MYIMCQKFLSVAELFYRRKLSAKELWAEELWAEELWAEER
jgi:hypothetical protein